MSLTHLPLPVAMLATANMLATVTFADRLKNYWSTRPDTLDLGIIKDLNIFLSAYQLTLKFIPCEDLPEFGLLQSPKAEAQAIYSVLHNSSIVDNSITRLIERYIESTLLTFHEYQSQQNYIHVDKADYQDFVKFISHPNILLEFKDSVEVSYICPARNWIEGNPTRLLAFYQQFFEQSRTLLDEYTPKQLDKILQFIFGHYHYGVNSLIYDSRIAFVSRQAVIQAIYNLYTKLFIHDPIEYHRYMLWDDLAFNYTVDSFAYYFKEEEKTLLQNVMFETLGKILNIKNKDCQFAALHGLNHLRHPETESLIRQYMASHDDLTEDDIEFAEACITGTMM